MPAAAPYWKKPQGPCRVRVNRETPAPTGLPRSYGGRPGAAPATVSIRGSQQGICGSVPAMPLLARTVRMPRDRRQVQHAQRTQAPRPRRELTHADLPDELFWIRFFNEAQLAAQLMYTAHDLGQAVQVQHRAPIVLKRAAGMQRRPTQLVSPAPGASPRSTPYADAWRYSNRRRTAGRGRLPGVRGSHCVARVVRRAHSPGRRPHDRLPP